MADVMKNTGHGWVYPRPDGAKARCGGPRLCKECARDLAEKEAALTRPAPSPSDADLIRRLRGEYRIPITDGLGAAGGEEPDNPNEFVRRFETPPIQHEAADRLEVLARMRGAAVPEWRTIDSAPKDGRDILCWHPGIAMGAMVLHWLDGMWREKANNMGLKTEPTHWQPLPKSPEAAQ